MPRLLLFALIFLAFAVASELSTAWAGKPSEGKLELLVSDEATGQPVACRVHLQNAAGLAKKVLKMPFWNDHFVCPGNVLLKLPKGQYTFVIERGPEYVDCAGYFTIEGFASDSKAVTLKRAANMASEGWWSGDLRLYRSAKDIELLMQAEDLHVAPLVTWTNQSTEWSAGQFPAKKITRFDTDRFFDITAGEDQRPNAGVLYFRLEHPLDFASAAPEPPTSLAMIEAAHAQPPAWVDLDEPLSPDLPLYLALGRIDSFELAHDELQRAVGSRGAAGLGPASELNPANPTTPSMNRVKKPLGKPKQRRARNRPRHAGGLFSSVELRLSHSAFGRQRQWRGGQSGGLQPHVCLSRSRRAGLRRVVGRRSTRTRHRHERPTDPPVGQPPAAGTCFSTRTRRVGNRHRHEHGDSREGELRASDPQRPRGSERAVGRLGQERPLSSLARRWQRLVSDPRGYRRGRDLSFCCQRSLVRRSRRRQTLHQPQVGAVLSRRAQCPRD